MNSEQAYEANKKYVQRIIVRNLIRDSINYSDPEIKDLMSKIIKFTIDKNYDRIIERVGEITQLDKLTYKEVFDIGMEIMRY